MHEKCNKKIPINRINKFFSEEDFGFRDRFWSRMVRGGYKYKSDTYFKLRGENHLNDDIYGETGRDEIRFKPPVEITVNFQMEAPSNKAYNSDGSLRYLEHGNLTLGVYQDHLDELEVEVNYGDYIGYAETEDKLKYYTVSNNGIIHSDNDTHNRWI